jgi:hypothetical protein
MATPSSESEGSGVWGDEERESFPVAADDDEDMITRQETRRARRLNGEESYMLVFCFPCFGVLDQTQNSVPPVCRAENCNDLVLTFT